MIESTIAIIFSLFVLNFAAKNDYLRLFSMWFFVYLSFFSTLQVNGYLMKEFRILMRKSICSSLWFFGVSLSDLQFFH